MHEKSYKNPSRVCVRGGSICNITIAITINIFSFFLLFFFLLLFLLILFSNVQNLDPLKCSIVSPKFILYLDERSPQSKTPVVARVAHARTNLRDNVKLFDIFLALIVSLWQHQIDIVSLPCTTRKRLYKPTDFCLDRLCH